VLLSVRIENFLVYSSSVDFSLLADKRLRRFCGNVAVSAGESVLKSACIYGANNVGKSCALRAIKAVKEVLSGKAAALVPNFFSDRKTVALGVSFTSDGQAFSFDFVYDAEEENGKPRGFIYERLTDITKNKRGRYREKQLYLYDAGKKIFTVESLTEEPSKLQELLKKKSGAVIAPFAFCESDFFNRIRTLFEEFSARTEIVDMTDISLAKTLDIFKNGGENAVPVRTFIVNSDLEIEDVYYKKTDKNIIFPDRQNEKSIYRGIAKEDVPCLITVKRGKETRCDIYDSTGTKKVIAVASYIVEALKTGKTLVIDELDSGLHFKLTRAVVSLFNNPLNENGQLIFTTHDVTLLDCKKLFRKDQIWFAAKDKDGEYLYALSDFDYPAAAAGVNELFGKYRSGLLGALPEPDLVSIITKKVEEEDN